MRGSIAFDELRQDLRFAGRRLRKSPGFAAVTIVTLALGIGANTAVFSLVNAVLLRPLPFRDPEKLVLVYEGFHNSDNSGIFRLPMSPPDIADFKRMQRSYEDAGIYRTGEYELGGIQGDPERVKGGRVSANLFPLLGLQPALGRGFTAAEDRPGGDVVILSHALWQRRFGLRRDVIGQTVMIDRRPHVVVGVMPKGLQFPPAGAPFNGTPADLLLPIAFTDFERQARGMMFNNNVVARLKPDATIERARAELPSLVAGIMSGYPAELRNAGIRLAMSLEPMHGELVGNVRAPLLVLLGAVGLVLLVACANVANLFVSRAAARDHEMTVRIALGAGRGRLRKMLLTESLVLALAGGVAGLLLAWWATRALPSVLPASLALLEHARPDAWVLAFTIVISVLTALLFGLAPLAARFGSTLQQSLRESGGSVTLGRARHLTQKLLVVTTVTLAVVLLIGAGLLIRSFAALLRTDIGFRPEGVLTATVALPEGAYDTGPKVRGFYQNLFERAGTLPGVTHAGFGNALPLAAREHRAYTAESELGAANAPPRGSAVTWVAGDFFAALGMRLMRGRFFEPSDERPDAALVIIVSDRFARGTWPGADPLGQRVKWGIRASTAPWMTVVGVVSDAPEERVDAEPGIHVYQPYLQLPDEALGARLGVFRLVHLVLRTPSDPVALAPLVRNEVRRLDPALAIANISTMRSRVDAAVAPQRLSMTLLAIFAAAALLMASVGLYGVLAYSVAQRTREIGVRIALGAARRDVVRLVAGQGLKLTAVGLVLGLAAAFGTARVMTKLLYNTTPHDAATFAAVPIVIALVAVTASYLPARRAARVDPIRALRVE